MPGSCDWFLNTEEYKLLVHTTYPFALRIVGRPGEGKTILASFIIGNLLQQALGRALYFFCKAGDAEKRLAIHVIRTLLSQLLRLDEDAYSLMERWYHNSGRPTADSVTEISSAFARVLSKPSLLPLFIVVDAIDECSEPQELITTLSRFQEEAARPIKIIYTSRDHPDLRPMFAFCQGKLSIPLDLTKHSINAYVQKKVLEMRFLTGTGLATELISAISSAADGLWLYARLILDEIRQAASALEVRRLLERLPGNLRELYTSILTSSEARFSELQVRIAQEIFVWIDGADYMPWWHFHSNDIMEDNVLTLLVTFANGGETVFDAVTLIQKLCFPLVDVFETTEDGTLCLFAASFVHYSAEQYLQWTSNAPLELLPNVLKPRRLRRLHRGITATWYFTESTEFKTVLQELRDDPYGNGVGAYFEMAYGMGDSWHMPCLPPHLEMDELRQVALLCRPLTDFVSSTACLGWAEAAILINYAGGFTNLLENVEKAVNILADQLSNDSVPAWQHYVLARNTFFTDFTYVLRTTGPGYKSWDNVGAVMPDGFEGRDYAMGLLALGKQYQHYVDEAPVLTGLSGVPRAEFDTREASGRKVSAEWQRKRSSQEHNKEA
jgi:hypothetical protein